MTIEVIKRNKGKAIIKCAFCHGIGSDPFDLLSPLAACQVCLGDGRVTIDEPIKECAFCQGTGVHRDQRLTCTVCGGRGAVTIPKLVETCPHCHGRGVAVGEYLPCGVCGGVGVIAKKEAV